MKPTNPGRGRAKKVKGIKDTGFTFQPCRECGRAMGWYEEWYEWHGKMTPRIFPKCDVHGEPRG